MKNFVLIFFLLIIFLPISYSIDLTQCQNITSSGTYVLANDVSASGTCFNITADLVELDCNEKRIDYAQAASGYGIYVDRRNNVTVKNCRIFDGNYDYSYGIYLNRANYTRIEGNNVSTGGDNADGVYAYYSINNILVGNNVSTGGNYAYGVYLYLSSNNSLISTLIKTIQKSSYGIYIYSNSFDIALINTTINTSSNDIRFRRNSSMQIINTSFNKSSVFWEPTAANAWINVSYYVDVLVESNLGYVDSAQVNITNYTNSLVFSGYTSSNGYITTQILPEFFANGTYSYSCPSSQANLTCASPYNFSASKGNSFNSTVEAINQSKTVEIILYFEYYYITIVGNPTNWSWVSIQLGKYVRSGNPTNWSWRQLEINSGRYVPKGNPTNWSWESE
ncbi:MAG: right-handed parallel beta-helix repeat-containing protein [Candidatus Aenigmarchaeota archaeon]|nr:right-handed parallel beta-helix repeat-containing protein [Candidatus Aenigmarchaeota archaeon]